MLKRMIENGFVLKETIEMKYPEKKNQNSFWRRRVSTYIYILNLLIVFSRLSVPRDKNKFIVSEAFHF
jgi:hypothetical protein